ncbi:Lpg1974 family pore-forming outer membrane protein [Candidatus Neptunichlamydia sp. REUL1]|uniref:Lpg1974 family pore-forming outer membrane protein n=1 Tax=Candidatus Neptunichlamydia sp. REUL1 TaxID=3064277 RepID=UPI0029315BB7|nr:Lpg1974 family pore-forming outer membrane protein [Candidatus Neptunochlamydia sp. REUL1]
MEVKLRKIWPLVGALCATVFSSAFAHSNYSSGSSYGSSMDSSNGSTQSGQGTYQRGTFREITPNAGPRVAHGADVFVTADFIWWKATQDGLNYAMSGVASPANFDQLSSTVGVTGRGSVSDPSFGWDPGFKVGLGLNLSHDGWDLYTQYTWLHSSASSSSKGIGITNSVNSVVAAIALDPALNNAVRNADWDLHFNVIDLELGRSFYLSQYLVIRPHFGLKGTWQEQDFKTKITADSSSFSPDLATASYNSHQDHDTWGLGIRGGVNLAWYMTKSWSIFGNVAWSAMWTHYDVDRKDQLTLLDNSETNLQLVNTEMNNYRVRYVSELELGLRWEMWFYDDNYHFAIQAGWEEQVWLSYGNFIRLYNDTQGDLSLHGLNLKFRFDF